MKNPNVTAPGVFIETPSVATGIPGVYTANLDEFRKCGLGSR